MSKPVDIINQLLTQLQDSSALSYVQDANILKGARESITLFPCIVLEPIRITEKDYVYEKQRLVMNIAVVGFTKVLNKDDQITGSGDDRGIMTLENDVKKAISSDITLGGYAIDTNIKETVYELIEYPIRGFSINIEVLFEQDAVNRT